MLSPAAQFEHWRCAMSRVAPLRLAWALAAALLCSPAASFTFLGLTVGDVSSTSRITSTLSGATCGETHMPGEYVCTKFEVIAGHRAEIYVLLGAQSKIERIQVHFDSGDAEEVDRMLHALYGAPATTSSQILWSHFGRLIVRVWRDGDDAEARYSRLTGPFGLADLAISTKQDRAAHR